MVDMVGLGEDRRGWGKGRRGWGEGVALQDVLGGAGGVDLELVARLSCVGFFHTVGLKEVENNINDVTCYTQACAMHKSLF